MRTKTVGFLPVRIGKNKQNDEKNLNDKIYKVFAKNIIEIAEKITILNTVKGYDFLHRLSFMEE